ncbi:MAG: hypothetical protein M0P47_10910 [Bacteroidales bacterium]|nr:hypothetical protein [Bacteroidales bacterium]
MKNIHSIFSLILFSSILVFTSCSKSDSSDPVDQTPAINFVGGSGYISADATLSVSEIFKVGLTAFPNTNSGAKLTKLTITRVCNNQPLVQDSVFSTPQASLNIIINAVTNNLPGQEKWYFKITDKNGQTKEISFTITTIAVSSPINTFSMKILGAQGNTTGSSFASIDGTVYTLANAKTNASKIDWLYFYGETNHASIAAPSDASAAGVFNGDNGLASWAVRNNTLFKKVTEVINWESITNDQIIVAQTTTGVTNTKINELAVNDILAFITAGGKKGLMKVETISGTTAGSMTLSVKVQQ